MEEAMSLLSDAMERCTILNKRIETDGMGGYKPIWEDGVSFDAAITFDTSIQARAAQKQGVSSLYTITTDKGLTLEYHDVLRREFDGKILRVTSDGDDKKTPATASLNMRQVTAEEWSLPQ
jgi:hypothetical protein